MKPFRKFNKSILILIVLIQSISLAQLPLTRLNESAPIAQKEHLLPPEQYVDVEVAQLANPILIWANIPLLKELGFEVSETLTQADEKELLKTLAWVVPDSHINPNEITSARKKMVSDFYGGSGIGSNNGSARAASGGMIQIKGIGITPHFVSHTNNPGELPGRATIHEAIKDAVWGEILNNELPYGANRLVAIIDRGTLSPGGEAQVLEVRIDPIRAGHYIPRYDTSDAKDKDRARISLSRLEKALPIPPEGYPENSNRIQRMALGLIEYSRRLGIQYAHLLMKRLYHGATSESNIEISGKMIDFGTASAQAGYEKIQFLNHSDAFGKISDIEAYNLQLLSDNLLFPTIQERRKFNSYLQEPTQGRSINKMITTFRITYRTEKEKLALQLMGLPRVIVDSLYKQHQQLASKLVALVEEQIKKSEILELKPYPNLNSRSLGPIQEICDILYNNKPKTNQFIQLEPMIQNLIDEATQWSLQSGVSKENFFKLISYNSRFMNKPMQDLFITNLRETTKKVNEMLLQGNSAVVANAIHDIVRNSIRETRGLEWYEASYALTRDKNGNLFTQIYDAKENSTKTMAYHTPSSTPSNNLLPNRNVSLSCKSLFKKAK